MILATEGVGLTYRAGTRHEIPAVADVSLGIPKGSTTLVRGASGSGKTSLLCLLGTLLRPTAGRVLLEGRGLGEASDAERTRIRRHRIGFVWGHTRNPLVNTRCELRERRAAAANALRYANQTLGIEVSKSWPVF